MGMAMDLDKRISRERTIAETTIVQEELQMRDTRTTTIRNPTDKTETEEMSRGREIFS